jgi:hypothetical protein
MLSFQLPFLAIGAWCFVLSSGKMEEVLTWKHPFTCLISGPTGSGKTMFLQRLLTSELIKPKPEKIVWCYGQYQNFFEALRQQLPHIEFVQGAQESVFQKLLRGHSNVPTVVVIDDLMDEMANHKMLTKLFVQGSHHCNLSLFFLVQNLFFKGKEMRSVSLNCQMMVLFKSVRDGSQVQHLSTQMFGPKSKLLQEAYADATSRPFGYLVINMTPRADDRYRLLTNIFPDETPAVIYSPKSF